mmetsp:Transcript_130470/g.309532  ORF Transcript_130470/g.309532 Transcript_130470/m.309532 type:complete len:230 (-) Transcript_130470:625-1314(-)
MARSRLRRGLCTASHRLRKGTALTWVHIAPQSRSFLHCRRSLQPSSTSARHCSKPGTIQSWERNESCLHRLGTFALLHHRRRPDSLPPRSNTRLSTARHRSHRKQQCHSRAHRPCSATDTARLHTTRSAHTRRGSSPCSGISARQSRSCSPTSWRSSDCPSRSGSRCPSLHSPEDIAQTRGCRTCPLRKCTISPRACCRGSRPSGRRKPPSIAHRGPACLCHHRVTPSR